MKGEEKDDTAMIGRRTPLTIRWLRFGTSTAGVAGLIPGQGTIKSCMPLDVPAKKKKKKFIDRLLKTNVVMILGYGSCRLVA